MSETPLLDRMERLRDSYVGEMKSREKEAFALASSTNDIRELYRKIDRIADKMAAGDESTGLQYQLDIHLDAVKLLDDYFKAIKGLPHDIREQLLRELNQRLEAKPPR